MCNPPATPIIPAILLNNPKPTPWLKFVVSPAPAPAVPAAVALPLPPGPPPNALKIVFGVAVPNVKPFPIDTYDATPELPPVGELPPIPPEPALTFKTSGRKTAGKIRELIAPEPPPPPPPLAVFDNPANPNPPPPPPPTQSI